MTPSRAPASSAQNPRRSSTPRSRCFRTHGFRGATLDQIAEAAGLSKPNLLYYFASKEAIHDALLTRLLDTWLDPLRALDPDGRPGDGDHRLCPAQAGDEPRLSARKPPFRQRDPAGRAAHPDGASTASCKTLVDEKAGGAARLDGRRAASPAVDPVHLIFSIWALTQHYADFDIQVRAVLGPGHDPFPEAQAYLDTLFRRLLAV